MSTNSNCLLLQVRTDQWFYVLEHRHAPQNAWDWREHASAYGPFSSEEEAIQHLRDNHANPGGSSTSALPDGVTELDLSGDEVLQKLIQDARARPRRPIGGAFWRRY
jgi:hypothetical protein